MKKKQFISRKNSEHISIDKDYLKRICLAKVSDFSKPGFFKNLPTPEITHTIHGVLIYFDMGSDILGVAHLDSHGERYNHFEQIGDRLYNASVDDRVGAYIVTEMLSQKKYPHDILLTVGEETAQSTAQFFTTTKQYNWMFEFDRGGTDMVMYEFENAKMRSLIKDYGWHVGQGSFTDIVYLDQLDCKGFNFSAGFYDYHGEYAYVDIIDVENSIQKFTAFYLDNKYISMEHVQEQQYDMGWSDMSYNSKHISINYVVCVVCKSAFSIHSHQTEEAYNVDDILAFGTCTMCTEYEDSDLLPGYLKKE